MKLTINPKYLLIGGIFALTLFSKPMQLLLLLALIVLLICSSYNEKMKFLNMAEIFFIVFYIIYLTSILLHSLFKNPDFDRILAAFNSLIIGIVSLAFYHYYKNTTLELDKILKAFLFNGLILFFLGGTYYYCLHNNIQNISIFGRDLIGSDWINGMHTQRAMGFFEYSNLIIPITVVTNLYIYIYMKLRNYSIMTIGVVLLFTFILPIGSGSRAGIVAILAQMFILLLNTVVVKKKTIKFLLYILPFLLVIVMMLYFDNLLSIYYRIINLRSGSSESRFSLYKDTVNIVINSSLLFGEGVKELWLNSDLPLGSHSTYIGYFYKSGLLGLMNIVPGLLLIFTNIGRKAKQSAFYYEIVGTLITLFSFFALEDLDGANWLIVFIFTVLGILENKDFYSQLKRWKS
ncbi:TPA: O-antigen ligase family protein [Streptococcus agalactiae]|nr:O-antigen ligase family protein [Streptococcus agalactiae]